MRFQMLEKRSFSLSGHRTSIALEAEFWAALERIAQSQARPVSALVTALDSSRATQQPLASALRVFALLHKEN